MSELTPLKSQFSGALASAEPRQCSVQCIGPHGLHRMAYVEWGDPANPRVQYALTA